MASAASIALARAVAAAWRRHGGTVGIAFDPDHRFASHFWYLGYRVDF